MNWLKSYLCCAWCLHGAELSLGHFGTSAELSQHFMKGPKCPTDTSALVPNCLGPKCLGSEVSVHQLQSRCTALCLTFCRYCIAFKVMLLISSCKYATK